jgi:protein-S-isoprenylcysteine O-methyltransferase Ste14
MESALLILLAVFVYGLVHSVLASLGAKARARQWFGPATDRWYRLGFNIFGVISLLPVLALPAILPDQPLYTIPAPWTYLALAGQAAAVVMLVVGVMQTGAWSFLGLEQLSGRSKPDSSPGLVMDGLYRWVRHPLYTAGLLFIWLIPVMTVNLLTLNIGLTAYLIVGAWFEERKLVREFGEVYVEYRKVTPMLIPRPPRKTFREA